MKSVFKFLSVAALSGAVILSLNNTASAQHERGGGGGGGSSSGSSRPSGGGGGFSGGHTSVAPPASQPAPSNNSNSSGPRVTNMAPRTGATRGFSGPRTTTGTSVPRGGSYASPRQNTWHSNTYRSPVSSYRTYQRPVYGHNYPGNPYRGAWRSTGYFHYNRGYYGSYYYPRLGFSINVLPYGYYPFYYGDYQYYYSDGLFYQYNNDQYTVVEPPVGAEVTTLPTNAQSIVINGQQYYEVNGVYYEPITKDDGTLSYQVAGKDGELNTSDNTDDAQNAPPQIGDIWTQLPPGTKKINLNGDKLYVSPDGMYFKAQLDQDSNKVYKIVGLPTDDQPADQ